MGTVTPITEAKSCTDTSDITRAMMHLETIDTRLHKFAENIGVDIVRIRDVPGGRHFVMDDMIIAVLPGIGVEHDWHPHYVLRGSIVFIVGWQDGRVARHYACRLSDITMLALGRAIVQAQSRGFDVSLDILPRVIDYSRQIAPGISA